MLNWIEAALSLVIVLIHALNHMTPRTEIMWVGSTHKGNEMNLKSLIDRYRLPHEAG
jgi:hypothetical protein